MAATWEPRPADLLLWLDASRGDTLTITSGRVTNLADRAPGGFQFQPLTIGPHYSAQDQAIVFNEPGVVLVSSGAHVSDLRPLGMVAVIEDLAPGPSLRWISLSATSNDRAVFTFTESGPDGSVQRKTSFIRGADDVVQLALGQLSISAGFNQQRSITEIVDTGHSVEVSSNASNAARETYHPEQIHFNIITLGGIYRPINEPQISFQMPFKLHELLLYRPGPGSEVFRQLLQGYVAHKWGLTDRLLAGHWFKSHRPLKIQGRVETSTGHPAEKVFLITGIAGQAQSVTPATDGSWQGAVRSGQPTMAVYHKSGCAPVVHGFYTVED